MKDRFLMDGHKLHWHLDRVVKWLEGDRIAPIHIDAGLSKGCNIKCHYCFGMVQGNLGRKGKDKYFAREPLLNYMRSASEVGVRSIAMIGEGEPLINPHVYEAVVLGKKCGMDMAIGTNGILFDTGKEGEAALEHLTFIRFNISAGTELGYRRIHGSKEFETAKAKIRFCVEQKRRKNLDLTIGLQMVLTPKDLEEVIPLTQLGKEYGVDYLVIKQCSDTQDNRLGIRERLHEYNSEPFVSILKQAEEMSTNEYSVIVKWLKVGNEGVRNYDQCLGVPFLIYTSGDGRVYPCGDFFDRREAEFRMGDLNQMSFKEILESERYWDVVERVKTDVSVHDECYSNCRTHCVNEYLWMLKHPPQHVNFV